MYAGVVGLHVSCDNRALFTDVFRVTMYIIYYALFYGVYGLRFTFREHIFTCKHFIALPNLTCMEINRSADCWNCLNFQKCIRSIH